MDIKKLAVAGLVFYAGMKWVKNPAIAGAMMSVAAVSLVKQTPIVNQYLA